MEGNIVSSNERYHKPKSPGPHTAQRYSQPIPAQTTKSPRTEGGATRSQRSTRQPRPQTPANTPPSFLESAVAKVGRVAQSVTSTSPAKTKSVLVGNKKRALDAERTTTPTPQSYNNEARSIGNQFDPSHRPPWDEDIESTGDEGEQGEIDQNSMQTDSFSILADRLEDGDKRFKNLYSSLVEAGSLVQSLESDGMLGIIKADPKITGCLTEQPYKIIMEQQATLTQAMHEVIRTMASHMEKTEAIGDKVERMREETTFNFSAMAEQLKVLETANNATQTRFKTLDEIVGNTSPQNTGTAKNTSFTTSYATGPLPKPKGKTVNNPGQEKPNTNPAAAHHLSRAVIRFLPDGIRDEDRMEPALIVSTINNALANSQSLKAKHIRAVTASYNNQGNLIVSTRADQLAADLLQYAELFIPLINQGYETSAREDKRWFKIQIDGVSTHTMTRFGPRSVISAETVHEELLACNVIYAQAIDNIVAPPRWMRTQEELDNTLRSSLVFAVDDEEVARGILQGKTLAAFARHCPLRAYQDRPPVKQCKNCWGWDHKAENCPNPTRCRLCADNHKEEDHPAEPDCRKCKALEESDGPPSRCQKVPHSAREVWNSLCQ
ncbi:uncharacterized protein LACBIDRAFT_331226 [Laccaria bicolor S238N-H82]|uniref:Predicted protein n=1 Tax=Laccaria bicolor (strain S238N-H82 / ATCC MYA-4686) TaxID=486041 RepID=B0DNU8_LACBS|nr:uncharacterized protein LACBIDRAFT_331226 [Laccaria bicolor S238N-H82]EDR03788.1 predicted protein [Laccaria bicolor S238N-H82]|eukprot:XP_001885641.1 predicted protein [Laccaria bicolor S238N-H82]